MINSLKLGQMNSLLETRPSPRDRINRVLWQVLGINLGVAGAKIIAGFATGSISMLADGFHSLMDASSNVIGLIGSTIAGHPPDAEHPYGHHKYETFAMLGIGLMLLFTSWHILQSVFNRIFEDSQPEVTVFGVAVMAVGIVLNIIVTSYESHQGKQLKSSILLADAAHTRSDIFVSLSVLLSLLFVHIGWGWVDVVVAVAIVILIGKTGWGIVHQASNILADCAVVDPNEVTNIALSIDGVESCHKVRSRGTDQIIHLDLHIQVDGTMPLEEAHDLGHLAQQKLKEKLGVSDVLVHVEPIAT